MQISSAIGGKSKCGTVFAPGANHESTVNVELAYIHCQSVDERGKCAMTDEEIRRTLLTAVEHMKEAIIALLMASSNVDEEMNRDLSARIQNLNQIILAVYEHIRVRYGPPEEHITPTTSRARYLFSFLGGFLLRLRSLWPFAHR
jgi:predicted nucleic acid-binding protein